MKKTILFSIIAIGFASLFSSCSQDEDITPTLLDDTSYYDTDPDDNDTGGTKGGS